MTEQEILDARWIPGICLECGESLNLLLHIHAQSHGYKDAYDQIRQGKYYIDKRYKESCKKIRL